MSTGGRRAAAVHEEPSDHKADMPRREKDAATRSGGASGGATTGNSPNGTGGTNNISAASVPEDAPDDVDEQWQSMLQVLSAFKAKFGHFNVPRGYVVGGVELGEWTNAQRFLYRGAGLKKIDRERAQERIRRLEAIGFIQHGELMWRKSFEHLLQFQRENGHFGVPSNTNLYQWVGNQRKEYKRFRDGKKGKINQSRIDRLTAAGFDLDITVRVKECSDRWFTNLELLKDFHKSHGSWHVPKRIKGQYYGLGEWVAKQKYKIKRSLLVPEQLDALVANGVDWVAESIMLGTKLACKEEILQETEDVSSIPLRPTCMQTEGVPNGSTSGDQCLDNSEASAEHSSETARKLIDSMKKCRDDPNRPHLTSAFAQRSLELAVFRESLQRAETSRQREVAPVPVGQDPTIAGRWSTDASDTTLSKTSELDHRAWLESYRELLLLYTGKKGRSTATEVAFSEEAFFNLQEINPHSRWTTIASSVDEFYVDAPPEGVNARGTFLETGDKAGKVHGVESNKRLSELQQSPVTRASATTKSNDTARPICFEQQAALSEKPSASVELSPRCRLAVQGFKQSIKSPQEHSKPFANRKSTDPPFINGTSCSGSSNQQALVSSDDTNVPFSSGDGVSSTRRAPRRQAPLKFSASTTVPQSGATKRKVSSELDTARRRKIRRGKVRITCAEDLIDHFYF